ncbi:DNA recombination-mediator protein A [Parafrankia irregularis]|uniref:DNA recombination-mediator protein A n=1 Tax=Parafrankia irregularis TaxID=795642 RepID=A0A0S4R2J9_9ACTN|nr:MULTISPECIES: DNA-processing protein DprA [Parafrankia]MBE3206608.1 DNA-processing protein DprA [Parafrankia sp. CH37]MBE3206730.1 DNA-processing protein DprA [Parafrankia sp. CH37]CUU61256.1 DNA recombination-mediator protein A [Parafrankia irregularis]
MPADDQRHARAALTALSSTIPLSATPSPINPAELWARLAPHYPGIDPAQLLDSASAEGWQLLIPGDPWWPAVLDTVSAGPVGLWVRGAGDLPNLIRRSVTVVGGLFSTDHGERITHHLVWDLTTPSATRPVAVASGNLGSGVNVTAVRVAAAHGRAVAVLSSTRSLTQLHRACVDEVAEGGIVLCMAPPGLSPTAGHAQARVRLLATLTDATILVESAARGATFATARVAHRYRRPVLVLPVPTTSALSAGPDALLRDGSAKRVISATEVLAILDQT